MSGKKYMIKQDDQFLGHWTAHTPEEAIEKMFNSLYSTCYDISKNDPFIVTKGDKIETVCL